MGWLIAFSILGDFALTLARQASGSEKTAAYVGFFLCLADRYRLKKSRNIDISFARCLLPPTYLYKRAGVLNEGKTKFYVLMCLYVLLIGWDILTGLQ